MARKFRQVSLPSELVEAVREYVNRTPLYSSVGSFVQDAVRKFLEVRQHLDAPDREGGG